MALNKRLLRKVAKIPESYDQGEWCEADKNAPCGTVACLAGETIICGAPSVAKGIADLRRAVSRYKSSPKYDVGVLRKARMLLGIDLGDAEKTFSGFADEWPEPFTAEFAIADGPKARAEVAVAYLDECLRRGKVTW